MDPAVNFIRSEIGIGFTMLWGACLRDDREERLLFRMHAKTAYDAARNASVRLTVTAPDIIGGLRELQLAIRDWSPVKCADYKTVAFQWAVVARQYG